MNKQTEDALVFGAGTWVYCRAHLRAHETGWCSVGNRDKIALGVSTADEAYQKCRDWGLPIHGELEPPADPALLEAAQGVLSLLDEAKQGERRSVGRLLFLSVGGEHSAIARLRAVLKEHAP